MSRRLFAVVSIFSLAAGCTNLDISNPSTWVSPASSTPLVSSNPFDTRPTSPPAYVACAPATAEAASRAQRVGTSVVAANPQLAMKPTFVTVGAQHSEIFHQGTVAVTITEGLVKQCTTDAQLAAVLSLELGKMASEREVKAGLRRNRPDPMSVRLGNDYGSTQSSADRTELAERYKLDGDFPKEHGPVVPPDPQVLARSYLLKAGYAAEELNAVMPLLQAAEKNVLLEKQLSQRS